MDIDGEHRNLVVDVRERFPRSVVGTLMVAAAAGLWGCFSLFFRNAEQIERARGGTLSPATESFVFFGVVLVLLGPFSLFKKPQSPTSPTTWWWLAFFSIADAVNVLLYFAAMQRTSLATAVLTHYLAPLFVALLAPFFLKETLGRGTFSAVVAAFVGLALLLEPHRSSDEVSLVGASLGAGSAILFAGAMLSMKRLGAWFSSAQVLCLHYPGALLVLYFFIPDGELCSLSARTWGLLVLAGLLPGTLGGFLFVEGMRFLPASRAGILTLLEPVVALMIGLIFWNERPGLVALLGALIVLGAAFRVLRQSSTLA